MTNFKRVAIIALAIIVIVAFAGRALIAFFDLQCTSWWRSPWKNYEIGGKWFSLHQIGWGYDVVPVNAKIHALRAVWPFKWVVESDHIHLQIF